MTRKDTFKEAAHAIISITISALFFAAWSWGDGTYFTTWALCLYAIYFLTSATVSVASFTGHNGAQLMISDGRFARWVFAPCLVVSIAVAVTVIYILWDTWSIQFDEYCSPEKKNTCRDLMLSFIVVHYLPPVALLMASVTDDKLLVSPVRNEREKLKEEIVRYILILYQVSLVPMLVYSVFNDAKQVYGIDGTGSLLIFLCTSAVITTAWGATRNSSI
jgi:hypothetical protein